MSRSFSVIRFVLAATLLAACGSDDPAPDAATPPGDGAMCSGTIAYLQACAADNECTSCTCRSFGHSKVCTNACDGPEDCPAPSGGCSQGFCRP